jgi:hypothetical protein
MNDNDLERQLRAQAGPREEGYVPTRLPVSPDEAPSRRPSPLLRAAVLVPAVAAGVLAVALAGSLLSGQRGPTVGSNGSPTAQATPGIAVCTAADVQVNAEPWGGAAGSRGTVIDLSLSAGHEPCYLWQGVDAHIFDSSRRDLVSGSSLQSVRRFNLEPGRHFTVGLAWSNWCDAAPSGPYTVAIGHGITVTPAGANLVPPPCNGDGGTNLSVTEVQPAP